MILNRKVLSGIEKEARRLKALYEEPDSEVDKLLSEVKESVRSMPQNMTMEEEIAYMLNN